jgi:hypothetical protein
MQKCESELLVINRIIWTLNENKYKQPSTYGGDGCAKVARKHGRPDGTAGQHS